MLESLVLADDGASANTVVPPAACVAETGVQAAVEMTGGRTLILASVPAGFECYEFEADASGRTLFEAVEQLVGGRPAVSRLQNLIKNWTATSLRRAFLANEEALSAVARGIGFGMIPTPQPMSVTRITDLGADSRGGWF